MVNHVLILHSTLIKIVTTFFIKRLFANVKYKINSLKKLIHKSRDVKSSDNSFELLELESYVGSLSGNSI